MKIAILSDIHGNLIALDAVLNETENQHKVDGYWLLGDYCAIGSDPVAVLERLHALPNALFVRGNTDRYVTSPDAPPLYQEDVLNDPLLASTFAQIAANSSWTQGMLTATGWIDGMLDLPLEARTSLPDGTQVLLVHSTPGNDDGDGLVPLDLDASVIERFGSSAAPLIFVGHTHLPQDRRNDDTRIVNPGSIGNPVAAKRRACYVLLNADESGYELIFYEVDYDLDEVMKHIHDQRHPTEDYLLHFYKGELVPEWYNESLNL